MHTTHSIQTKRSIRARILTAVLALAALAVPSQSLALTLPPPVSLGAGSVRAVAPGYVVGAAPSNIPDGWGGYIQQAFVWSAASGTKQNIGALISGYSGYSVATGVNSQGEVVGGAYSADYSSATGFYWSQAAGAALIGPVGNVSQYPLFINENGIVAGTDASGGVFRWTLAGGVQNLGLAGTVAGINARGDVAINAGSQVFIVWGDGTPVTTLTSPGTSSPPPISIQNNGENNIQVNGINDSGVVVGTYWDYKYMYDGYDISQGGFFTGVVHNSHAFKWTASAGFTDLGNLGTWPLIGKPYPTYSYFAAFATAINNDGTIVGYSYLSAGNNYVPFVYKNGTLTQLPKLNPFDDYAMATGINDDGLIAGWSHQNQYSVLWENGVPTNVTPSFAGLWTGSPLIKGSTVAGNGQNAWTFALAAPPPPPPPPPPLPTQTLTILGGVGNPGDIAANVEYFNPATNKWQPAYLADYAPEHPTTHPWKNITGTTRWINYKTAGGSDPGAGPTTNQTLWYLYRVRFTVPSDAVDPQMTFSLKADNFAQIAINGVTAGGSTQFINNINVPNVIVGQPGGTTVNADAVFSQAVHPGENTITLNIGDWGGLNGFNFRIDLSMKSSQPIEIVTPPADTLPPVISAPADITREAASAAGTVVNFTATATDDNDGVVAVVASPPSGSTFALGTTTVDLGAGDSAGNVAHATFQVTVQDTIAPVIAVPSAVTAEATSASGASVTYALATATDAVGVTSLTHSPASGATFPLGTSDVTVTAGDAAGNSSTRKFTLTVKDTTAPSLTVPASQTLEATSAAGAVATFAASATDAVTSSPTIGYSSNSGSTFPIGTTSVNVTATDGAGNSSAGSFTVTVRDTTAPTLTSVTPSTGTLWPPNHQMVAITLNRTATDAVGVTGYQVTATSSEPDNGLGDGDTANDIQISGSGTFNPVVNLRAERAGNGNGRTYTITVVAIDAAGNASLPKSCTVFVPKSQGKK